MDVTVIGAGPAGSAAAIRLAQIGMKVRLYEKSRFPRPKLCGGFLSPESLQDLEELGVLEEVYRAGAVAVRRTLVSSPSGAQAEAPFRSPGLSLARDLLDNFLLERARAMGVEVHEGTDGFSEVSNEEWKVIATGRKNAEFGIRNSEYGSSLIKKPYSASRIPHSAYFGVQALFEKVDGITDQVELDLIPNGYVGFVRQGPHTVNVCALVHQECLRREGPELDAVLKTWTKKNPWLNRRLRNAQRIQPWQAVGPVQMGLRQLTEPKTLFVGDAACVVDPFVGEGIAMGLRASALLQKAFQGPGSVENVYARAWHAEFNNALRTGSLLRVLLLRPGLQNVLIGGLQMFPAVLGWLTEKTRPTVYAN